VLFSPQIIAKAPKRAGAAGTSVGDVFSADLWTGNDGTTTVTNGVNLSANGGLVWIKRRAAAVDYALLDSARSSFGNRLKINTEAEAALSTVTAATNGFSVTSSNGAVNSSSHTFVGWTFRKAAGFFDVVTYTGTGAAKTVAHNLGTAPGMILVKITSDVDDWYVYHRSLTDDNDNWLKLNSASAQSGPSSNIWNSTSPTSSVFTVGSSLSASGQTYVAYLFAHDVGASGIMQCGSFTTGGTGSATVTVTLGWQPQLFLMKKSSTGAEDWYLMDAARGMTGTNPALYPNLTDAEGTLGNGTFPISATSTGMSISEGFLSSSSTYIYLAIKAE